MQREKFNDRTVMKKRLGSQLLTAPQIFDDHIFNVPDYQRGYAWGRDQVKALLEDIEHLLLTPTQGSHFAGTLVVNQGKKNDRYDIVDGQQRLTTIVILVRCLHAEISDTATLERILHRYLRRGSLGNEQMVLQLGSDNREFFERVVLGNDSVEQVKPSLAAHQNLYEARLTIEQWLAGKQKAFAEKVLAILEQRFGLLVYNPAEVAEIGIMFEVINNRGKELSELEKVKNYLIYAATKLGACTTRELVNTLWSTILRNLHIAKYTDDKDEKSFLRSVSILQFSLNKTDSSHVYDILRNKFLKVDTVLANKETRNAAIMQIESFVRLLEKASHWYAVIYGDQHSDLHISIATVLERIYAQQQHANIMPVLLAVLIRRGGNPEDGTLPRLLELIETVNFRIYVAPGITRKSDSGQGQLYSIAANYHNNRTVHEYPAGYSGEMSNIDIQLEHGLVKFALLYATDEKLSGSLELAEDDYQFDFYKWGGLKYFLICYEASLKKSKTVKIGQILNSRSSGKSGDYFSVEHIWATKHEENIYNSPKDSNLRRRLGNFMLLELNLNIAGSNHCIQNKISIYSGKDMLSMDAAENIKQPSEMAQVRELISDAKSALIKLDTSVFEDKRFKPYRDLHNQICIVREARFAKFATTQWSLKSYHGYHEALEDIANDNEIPG